MPAKLFNIESLDGGGKTTQVKIVEKYLEEKKIKYKHLHFPMYGHNSFSETISMFLRGEFGTRKEVDPYFVANIFAMDRFCFLPELNKLIEENDLIILDRYVFSNIAYQGAKVSGKERSRIKMWINDFEYNFLRLPYPDLTIFLDNDLSVINQRLIERANNETREYLNGKKDIHEADMEFQSNVRDLYLSMYNVYNNYEIIPCVINNVNLNPDEIFETYKEHLNKIL